MIHINDLKNYTATSKPGDKLLYHTGRTGWSGALENQEHSRFFQNVRRSGEFDFVQKFVSEDGDRRIFDHFIIRRYEPLECNLY